MQTIQNPFPQAATSFSPVIKWRRRARALSLSLQKKRLLSLSEDCFTITEKWVESCGLQCRELWAEVVVCIVWDHTRSGR
ncbi:hypothetical protein SRHO_G00151670 [Serrasalmus rhombeus]